MRILAALIFSIWTFACLAQPVTPGEVMDSVVCSANPDFSYALYVPSNYSDAQHWPVIYILDPAARAKHALEAFREAAENTGFVLAASWQSRNGPMEVSVDAVVAMSKDLGKRIQVDPRRMMLAGFSGGARAASGIAMLSENIRAVIACGAGFPGGVEPMERYGFLYAGVAGSTDMNFTEVAVLDEKLAKLGCTSTLMMFEGGHSWMDSYTAHRLLNWIRWQEMKAGTLLPDKDFMKGQLQEGLRGVVEARKNGRWQELLLRSSELGRSVEATQFKPAFQPTLQSFTSDPGFAHAEKRMKAARKYELEKQREYEDAFQQILLTKFESGSPWTPRQWQIEKERWQKWAAKDTADAFKQMTADRLDDYVWRVAYINFNTYQAEEDYDRALLALEVWSAVRPERPHPWFHRARMQAAKKLYKAALQSIRKARELGMSRWDLVRRDPVFEKVIHEPSWQEVMAD